MRIKKNTFLTDLHNLLFMYSLNKILSNKKVFGYLHSFYENETR